MSFRRHSPAFQVSAARFSVVVVAPLVLLLVVAQPARAQDATVVVVALVPPILLAPVCLALGRWLWLRRRPDTEARFVRLLAVAALEVLLWGAVTVGVLKLMTGDAHVRVVAVPLVAGGALWMLSGVPFEPSQRAARWLYLASVPLALLGLAAATWMVLLAAW